MKLFLGKKLEYEPKCCEEKNGNEFITLVEFSAENPYGKAVALFDMKAGLIEVIARCFFATLPRIPSHTPTYCHLGNRSMKRSLFYLVFYRHSFLNMRTKCNATMSFQAKRMHK